jgi:hypothetical protein
MKAIQVVAFFKNPISDRIIKIPQKITMETLENKTIHYQW